MVDVGTYIAGVTWQCHKQWDLKWFIISTKLKIY